MSSKPNISAPFNPVHLSSGHSSEQSNQNHQRNPSSSSLSPHNSPYLRPTSSASSRTDDSPKVVRNFSRPTTPQPRPATPQQRPVTPQSPKSLSPESVRPQRKSWFKEEISDSGNAATGSTTPTHNTFPSGVRRGSSVSAHLLPPPSPSTQSQNYTQAKSYGSPSAGTGRPQAPPTPTSPSFLLSRDSEDDARPEFMAVELPGDEPSLSHEHSRKGQSLAPSSATGQQGSGSGLVSGERKKSMWERVLRRGEGEGEGDVGKEFTPRRSS